MKCHALDHQFVIRIPRPMADGILYVSMEFATAGRRCCCGCGNEVYRKFSRRDWQIMFDGQSVSLTPSIGN